MKPRNKKQIKEARERKVLKWNRDHPNELPAHIMSQISEHSLGGYYLCTISEEGMPVINFSVEHEVALIALTQHILRWAENINKIQDEVFQHKMHEGFRKGQ